MDNNKIINISVENIYQHPDNPRKDLGDLSELSESIKKNGIMQNLTVIPGHWLTHDEWSALSKEYNKNPSEEIRSKMNMIHTKKMLPEGYTLIIGHRRLAAAKMAGLKVVPCIIVDEMSKKEQVATMLEENIQRNDLTIWEQSAGFQMMLDLGDTEAQIAEKTGFSRTTIRHRLNIAKLDSREIQEKEKSEGFQLSLKDLYELEKIEDINTRNKVLASATNSRDLVWKSKQAVTDEIKSKNKKLFISLFEKAGIKKAPDGAENERYTGKWVVLQSWELINNVPETLEEFTGDAQWVVYYGNTIAVITPAKKTKRELSEYEIQEKERTKAKKELKQKHKSLYANIDRFLMGIITKEIEPVKEDVEFYKELVMTMVKASMDYYRSDLCVFYSGKGLYDLEHEDPEKFKEFVDWEEKLTPLNSAIAHMTCIRKLEMYNYNGEYHKECADRVKAIVNFLAKYGFSVSEDEQKIIDGTHELYKKRKI